VRARRLIAVVLAACALGACAGDDSGSGDATPETPSWNHDPGDTEAGPAAWGSVDPSYRQCADGSMQSPIDLGGAIERALPPLRFDYGAVPLVVENTGHTIEVAMPEGTNHTLTVGDERYRLVQYHFHVPSEHTIAGKRYDMEAHLVHEAADGRLAVVAVFLDESLPPSLLVESVLSVAPGEAGEETEPGAQSSVAALLPDGRGTEALSILRYTTYTGSLTTPDCSQGVRWLVLAKTLGVSPDSTERMRELIADFPGHDGYDRNNRPTQELNGREVVTTGE
jgi:carbonic anhydrase